MQTPDDMRQYFEPDGSPRRMTDPTTIEYIAASPSTVAAYNGQAAASLVTDSGAIGANGAALAALARAGRFRIIAEGDRMVVGYWPENDPNEANP